MNGRNTLVFSALLSIIAVSVAMVQGAALKPLPPRQIVCLDGNWEIEQGRMESPPQTFSHTVIVPGLVDMAQPAFEEVGKKSELRQAFWYRRTFKIDGPVPAVAILKIHKALFGTKVYLNGQVVGEHPPCFTPALMDVKQYLKGDGQSNELVIRVGADRESFPQDMPTGWDFEKCQFVPGIYDSVELILTGAPYIVNVQTVPNVPGKAMRVVAEIQAGSQPREVTATVEVCEATNGKRVGSAQAVLPAAVDLSKIDVTIPMPNCRLWSPEDPFLYNVKISTGADAAQVRFGMRSFRCDAASGRMMLNEKPYFMRGTNVTIFRFFEDAQRGNLPWRPDWVRKLHQKYKTMHWNSIRYCIGFPPDFWYDIADEEGFLIQDEFPIWTGGEKKAGKPGLGPDRPKAENILPQYVEWMRERWNHPCVVIWDGQNESVTDETGKAIQAARRLDLSNRPWENGWSKVQSPTDCIESHPYLFSRNRFTPKKPFYLHDLEKMSGKPFENEKNNVFGVPVIINEYDWLWLTRDGNATALTGKIYDSLLGPHSTVAQRRTIHARYVAALTEFWRCHRETAGVLHFCGLGYSRPGDKPPPVGGATCDDFIDIQNLVFEPTFERYVGEAFSPVGLMLDFWADEVAAGGSRPVKVFVINDLDQPWTGEVRFSITGEAGPRAVQSQSCTVAAWGRNILTFAVEFPKEPGRYEMTAEIHDEAGKPVRSHREFTVKGRPTAK